eukprot:TRINITY_DN27791_c0_g1_i1.p1 TRINITY_DN27791_c0_g1~~TRINITY_DN27791_c0_g1_i1.p1  ORF type:complete len:189 (+),score=-11.16 TRINITY_DN27791_c0_g1_i1:138-704(+)
MLFQIFTIVSKKHFKIKQLFNSIQLSNSPQSKQIQLTGRILDYKSQFTQIQVHNILVHKDCILPSIVQRSFINNNKAYEQSLGINQSYQILENQHPRQKQNMQRVNKSYFFTLVFVKIVLADTRKLWFNSAPICQHISLNTIKKNTCIQRNQMGKFNKKQNSTRGNNLFSQYSKVETQISQFVCYKND